MKILMRLWTLTLDLVMLVLLLAAPVQAQQSPVQRTARKAERQDFLQDGGAEFMTASPAYVRIDRRTGR